MGWIERFREKRAKRAIRKLPKIERGVARFKQCYPDYEIGRGSYGLPLVHDWKEGSTLRIGAFCSIAEGVNIFLGGHHRADWVTTYPFPAMLKAAQHITDYNGTRGDVVVGSDVWLCSNSTVLSATAQLWRPVRWSRVMSSRMRWWVVTRQGFCAGGSRRSSVRPCCRQPGGNGRKPISSKRSANCAATILKVFWLTPPSVRPDRGRGREHLQVLPLMCQTAACAVLNCLICWLRLLTATGSARLA